MKFSEDSTDKSSEWRVPKMEADVSWMKLTLFLHHPAEVMPKIEAKLKSIHTTKDLVKFENKAEIHELLASFEHISGKGHNHDCCDACGEGGDLICCDSCPASFHLSCHCPPLEDDDIPMVSKLLNFFQYC